MIFCVILCNFFYLQNLTAPSFRLGIACEDMIILCSQVARKLAKQVHQRGRENSLHSQPLGVVDRKCCEQETKMVLLIAIVLNFTARTW